MKRIISFILVICLLMGIATVSAFGTGAYEQEQLGPGFYIRSAYTSVVSGASSSTVTTSSISMGGVSYTYYEGADKLAVSRTATNGGFYLVLMYTGDGTALPTSNSEIYYIDQVTASNNKAGFNVYPKDISSSTSFTLALTSNVDATQLYPVFYSTGDTYDVAQYTMGDVNDDGNIDSRDSLKILRFWASLEDLSVTQQSAADVNGDKNIDSRDSLRILRYWAGLDSLLPNN